MPKSLTKSRLEALLSMATGAAAEVPAGLAGLYGAATGGSGEAVRMIDKVRGKLTYQPRDPRGQQEIAGALAPLMQKIEAGKSALGDSAFNATGSPMAAAAAYTAPEALLSLLGARPALAAGRSASKGIGALVERSARLPAPAMGSPASQIGAIRAYHGSPHDFDRFSMDHIGTGEGAQAYGHGLYFAGKPEVADSYRKSVSSDYVRVADGALFNPRDLTSPTIRAKVNRGDIAGAIGEAERMKAGGQAWADADLSKLHDIQARGGLVDNPGNLYEVELAPDDADLLDWDAPLSEQPEKVRGAWDSFLATEKGRQYAAEMAGSSNLSKSQSGGQFDGASVYRNLQGAYEAEPNYSALASNYLRQQGIPGIRYLDGGSRAAGDGSRNYVMFDDSLIKILGKK